MYKNIVYMVMCISFLSVGAQTYVEKLSYVQDVIKKFNELAIEDLNVFSSWNNTFNTLDKEVCNSYEERRFLALKLQESFDAIQEHMKLSQEQFVQSLKEKDLTIHELEQKLVAVQSDAQHEIETLHNKIVSLDSQLSHMHEKYAAAVGLYEENIDGLVEELLRVKEQYVALMKAREEFLARLDSSIHQVRSYLSSVSIDNRELGAYILGSNFIEELHSLFNEPVSTSESELSDANTHTEE